MEDSVQIKMERIKDEEWMKEWKRKRKMSFIGFVLMGTVAGIDSSVIYSTMYSYLKNLIKTEKPELYYSMIVLSFCVASALSGIIFGRWTDKTRRVRLLINILIILQVVGFLLFSIPYHAAILIVARFVCGMGSSFASVITGEIYRIFDGKESTRAVLWMASMFSFGFVIGPALNFMFADVDFQIGTMEVNNLNFVGIFMAALLVIIMAITHFLVHDCSIELDSKIRSTQNEASEGIYEYELINGRTPEVRFEMSTFRETDSLIPMPSNSEVDPVKKILKALIFNIDTCLIFASTYVFVYAVFSASILLPIIADVFLRWSVTWLNFIYLGMGVSDAILLILMYKFCKSSSDEYVTSVVCLCSQLLIYCLIIYLKLRTPNFVRDILVMIAYPMLLMLGWCLNNVLLRVTLAKMIPTRIQSFTEGLRSAVGNAALVSGSLSAPLTLPWLHWWATAMMVLMSIIFVVFIIRKKHFIDPRGIDLPNTI